jgi:hypothetical protein
VFIGSLARLEGPEVDYSGHVRPDHAQADGLYDLSAFRVRTSPGRPIHADLAVQNLLIEKKDQFLLCDQFPVVKFMVGTPFLKTGQRKSAALYDDQGNAPRPVYKP